jgi:hypothetical protein
MTVERRRWVSQRVRASRRGQRTLVALFSMYFFFFLFCVLTNDDDDSQCFPPSSFLMSERVPALCELNATTENVPERPERATGRQQQQRGALSHPNPVLWDQVNRTTPLERSRKDQNRPRRQVRLLPLLFFSFLFFRFLICL